MGFDRNNLVKALALSQELDALLEKLAFVGATTGDMFLSISADGDIRSLAFIFSLNQDVGEYSTIKNALYAMTLARTVDIKSQLVALGVDVT